MNNESHASYEGDQQSAMNLEEEANLNDTTATNLSMQEVAPLMREQDADILESLHNLLPHNLSLSQHQSSFVEEILETVRESLDSSSRHLRPEDLLRRASSRKLLSGEIITNYEDSVSEVPDPMLLQRERSIDRQLSEVAQFAKAVGDFTQGEELRIIEDFANDEEDDDDDDDDACEIVVDEASRDDRSLNQSGILDESSLHDDSKKKLRPQWPFTEFDKLPDSDTSNSYVYKGICANPPDIVKSGMNRGNYAQLHRKAWLEVSDPLHRYGKNLRLYYRHWESLGSPTNMFFDWLDSKGEAEGRPLPEIEECPRSQLDSDTVLYITNNDVTQRYAINFVPVESGKGKVIDVDGEPVSTGSDGWIFVLRDNVMYGAQKITSVAGQTKERFHHSSFFGGKAVAAAGIFITDENGILTRLYPHSGHYRPGEAHVQRMLCFLYHEGVDLRTFEMDTQQMQHIARDGDSSKDGDKAEKKKKIESLHLMPAVLVGCFLAHKARFIGEGIFSQIHQIREADVSSVSEALQLIDKNRNAEDPLET